MALMGFVSDFGGQIILILVNFMTVPLILRFTSQVLYGFWLTTASIIGFLSLTDFGIGVPLTRAVAAVANRNKKEELNRVISTGFFSLCSLSVVFIAIGFITSLFVGKWFNIPETDQGLIIPAYLVAVSSAAVALPMGVFSNILNGFQRMVIDNTVRNIVSIFATAVTIVLLFEGFGLMSIALSSLFVILVTSSLNYFYVRRMFPDLSIRFSLFDVMELKKLLKFGGYFQIGRIANTVATSADNVVIAGVLGASYVTPYSLTSRLPVLFSINIASKLPTAVFPAISQMFAEGNISKLQGVFIKLATISVRLAVMAATFVFIANQQFISLWVGPDQYGGVMLNCVFIYWILQDTIYRGTTALVYASGDLRNWTIASILEAIFNITISILLARTIGIVGVALGTSISKTITTGFSTPYFISKKLNMSFGYFIKKGILKPLLISLPGVLFAWLVSIFTPISLGWIWIITVGGIIGFSNLMLFEGRVLLTPSPLSLKARLKDILKID
jgi:O-antigen/teichoic acid export membrane protein